MRAEAKVSGKTVRPTLSWRPKDSWAAAAAVFDGFGWTGRRMKSRQLLAGIQNLCYKLISGGIEL